MVIEILKSLIKIISKELLISFICFSMIGICVWSFDKIMNKVFLNLDAELLNSDISKSEYWMFLFLLSFIIVYGIRFVDKLIITVIKK